MGAYVAFIFTSQKDNISYMKEVAEAIKKLAGNNMKRGESSAGITAVAFITDADPKAITKAFSHLWRPEQRVWVLPLDSDPGPLVIDQALMEWVSRTQG